MARMLWGQDEYVGNSATPSDWGTVTSTVWVPSTAAARKDIGGNGGLRSMLSSVSSINSIMRSPIAAAKWGGGHMKFGFRFSHPSAQINTSFYDGASTSRGNLLITAAGTVSVGDTGGVLANVSLPSTFILGVFYLIEVEVVPTFGGNPGYVNVWVDGTQVITYTGGFIPGLWDNVRIQSSRNTYLDDFGINAPTVHYTGASATVPAAGQTITGANGASAIVADFVNLGGGTGYVTVYHWNGTPWVNGEVLTTASLAANVSAPTAAYVDGFGPNSDRLGNEFIALVKPTANGAQTNLTASSGGGPNYDNVNDVPINTATYNEASVNGDFDLYKNDAASVLPTTAQVQAVATVTYSRSSLTGLDNTRHRLRIDASNHDSPDISLPSSYLPQVYDWLVRPNDSEAWDRATLVAVGFENGLVFVT